MKYSKPVLATLAVGLLLARGPSGCGTTTPPPPTQTPVVVEITDNTPEAATWR